MTSDMRLRVLRPDQRDEAADRYLESLNERSRRTQRTHLERVATWVCAITRHQPAGFRHRVPLVLRPRLSAVPWADMTPELCSAARERALHGRTLNAASASLQPLRGTLRLALAHDPGRLMVCLHELRIDGTSAERREQTFWFEYDDEVVETPVDAAID